MQYTKIYSEILPDDIYNEIKEDRHIGKLLNKRGRYYLIYKENSIVGFIQKRKPDMNKIHRVGTIYIIQKYRNQGIAKSILKDFFFNKHGLAQIEDSNIISQKLFSSIGFKKTNKIVSFFGISYRWWIKESFNG